MMELKSSSHQTIILSGLTFAENKQSVKQSKMFKTDSAQRSSNKWKKYLPKTTHSTETFLMLFETSHSSSLAQVTPR